MRGNFAWRRGVVPQHRMRDIMAKSRRKKSKVKAKSKSKAKNRRKPPAKRKTRKTSAAKKTARRKSKTKKKRVTRRTEADMSWPEVRASRLRKSAGRDDRIVRDFDRAVNMTPQALEKWLGPNPASGHWSAQCILEIKRKKPADYTAEDYSHMRKVSAYVKRHGAQRPEGDQRETPWRYSLMNWGHDPLK